MKAEDGSDMDKGEGMDGALGGKALADANATIAKQEDELKTLRSAVADQALKVEKEEKTALAGKLSESLGVFDHSAMTLADVTAYGLEKFGLKAPEGAELAVLETHMSAVETSGGRFSAVDSADTSAEPSAVATFLQEKS